MKVFSLFLFFGFVFGALAVSSWPAGEASLQALSQIIPEEKQKFLKRASQELEFNFDEVPQSVFAAELLQPSNTLPHSFKFRFDDIAKLSDFEERCDKKTIPSAIEPKLTKALLWAEALCRGDILRNDFFAKPPFMHWTGESYVALALRTKNSVYHQPKFLEKNKQYLHITELKNFVSLLSPVEKLLTNLNDELAHITAFTDSTVRLNGRVLIIEEIKRRVLVYPSPVFDTYFRNRGFTFTLAKETNPCSLKEGNGCWERIPERMSSLWFSLFSALSLSSVALGACYVSWQGYSQRKQTREDQELILRTLTHELRTPLASLGLVREQLRQDFELMPPKAQDSFLRMSEDIQRLNRLSEASIQFLRFKKSGENFLTNRIHSVNNFCEELLSEFETPIRVKLLEADRHLDCSVFWLYICLKNLVENSITHGKQPVSFSVSETEDEILFSVEDSGHAPVSSLEELQNSSSSKKGLGMGLEIVRRVASRMKARLEFKQSPTTFIFVLRKKND